MYKRILVLNYEFPPLGGGASPVSYDLAKRLSETGEYDIDVVTMRYKDLPAYEAVNDHFRIHRVKCWRSKREVSHPWEQLTYLISAYFKCRTLLKKGRYDVCHCHFIIPTGVLALRLKREFGLPYIITSHGSDVLGYNARFKYLYPLLVRPWKRILDNARNIITPSHFLKDEILKAYPSLDEKRIIVIPNGIDTDKFKPKPKKNYIFSSGRLQPWKGFQYLIKAVSGEDLGWEVHIAGDGPMMSELKRLAAVSKTKIVFHGWLDSNSAKYLDLLGQASIFTLASKYESFGLVYAEALTAGCKVVSSDIPGAREVMGDLARYVDPEDSYAFKAALISEMASTSDIEKLVDKGRQYDWDIVMSKFEQAL